MRSLNRFLSLLSLLLILLLSACETVSTPTIQYDPASLKFSGEETFAMQADFVQRFPYRHSGMPNNQLAADWLEAEFTRLGLACQDDAWDIVNYSRPVKLRNVICRLPGPSPKQIVIMAHHDQSPDTIEGADNDASGIAIMLHLAAIFAAEPVPAYSLVFVAADAEEYGMIGSRRFIETHPDPATIIAAISLDGTGSVQWDFTEQINMM